MKQLSIFEPKIDKHYAYKKIFDLDRKMTFVVKILI